MEIPNDAQLSPPGNDKNSPPRTSLTNEQLVELFEVATNAQLEELLFNADFINAGNNGLIFRFNIEDLNSKLLQNEELRKRLPFDIALGQGQKVIKLLKLYNAGDGKREFEAQKRAHEIIAKQENTAAFAQIPQPFWFHDLLLSPETRQMLNQKGANLTLDRAEIIAMDYVDGEDLATIFYKWILDHAENKTVQPRDQSFNELHAAVSIILDYANPGGKSSDEGEREFERRKVLSENADRLYATLRKTGFQIPQTIVDQIANTLKLLHANGLHHNDPHERNFMIHGDRAVIVDFGSAGEQESSRVDDSYIVNRLSELLPVGEEGERVLADIASLRKRVESNPAWIREYEHIVGNLSDVEVVLGRKFAQAFVGDLEFNQFIILLEKLIDDRYMPRSNATVFIDKMIREHKHKIPTWAHNRLLTFRKTLLSTE